MAEARNFLALDLGAESGRGIIVSLSGGKASMEEIHRFPNRPVRMGGTLYWDLPFLLAEMTAAIRIAAQRGGRIDGISVDTWGVDFGLLGGDGRLLGLPVHYRDSRTEKIHDYSNKVMSTYEIFSLTAYEPWAISSLFQLVAMQRDKWATLPAAESFLNMPDLFHYFLTGRRTSEMSIANTSNLMGTDCRWSEAIISRFGLQRKLFGELVQPATVLGPLSESMRSLTGMGEAPVIATCGHDTSAALAAVPAKGDNWAFLSCGTWSIIGSLIPKPITAKRCLELGFTNEYTLGGWYIARNILGLWLVQELRRKWDTPADPWDYNRITAEAARATASSLVDVADASLLAPADMEEAIRKLLAAGGQPIPATRGEMVRCVLESLALEYGCRLDAVAELTGRRPGALYMVGGGIKNRLLCQFTANACGMPVHAGADQCTALGNGLAQALALGALKNRQEIRDIMAASSESTVYEPADTSTWLEKKQKYVALQRAAR
jgi:rhamnulokinase